jgi:hypothetical protein
MNIINNLYGNTPFFGRKGKIKENDRYELMNSVSASVYQDIALMRTWY